MPRPSFKLFVPIIAGATLGDRMIACLGALVGISLTGLICALALGHGPALPLIVAPMGASSVLLFATPASPMAQPWPIIGGNTLSALCGILAHRLVPDPVLASGLGVGLAIAVMSLTRTLHPPGGAVALTAVIGGPAVTAAGFSFAFVPVALNCVVLVALGWVFHRVSRHSYPHVPAPQPASAHATQDPAPGLRTRFRDEDIDAALLELGESFDIHRKDLEQLLRHIERHARVRTHGDLICGDIMSRDVVSIGPDADIQAARGLLLEHNIRTLPVIDASQRLLGTVGLRDIASGKTRIADAMVPAVTASPSASAFSQVEALTNGRTHAVVIVDDVSHVLGLLTQTDLLAALG